MIILPYRAKNPPEHTPYCTIGLIALNALVYVFTTDMLLVVKESALKDLALTHHTLFSEPWRLITAMFLHTDPFHLIGNMLFLWLFGAAAEGRLRPAKFLSMYFISGIFGALLQDMLWGTANPDGAGVGASGAIMGVAGAYLYLFPYSKICVLYWLGWFWRGVWEIQARWVVAWYVGWEVLIALFSKEDDGVGHLVHIGGVLAGFLFVLLFRERQDSEQISEAQAVSADLKDYSALSLSELATLMQRPTEDMNLVMTYIEKASGSYSGVQPDQLLHVIGQYGNRLLTPEISERLAYVLLRIPLQSGGMHPVFYLRLGSLLERRYSNDLASQVYRRVYDLSPTAPDTEMALYRLAHIMETAYGNRQQALAIYQEMLRLFPAGQFVQQAPAALTRGY